MTNRKIVIPGEIIASGDDYLPGNGTEKRGEDIIALRFGLSEESNNLMRIIPLSGNYEPRRGNVIIGRVEILTHNGWVINFGLAENAFLPLSEVPRFINRGELDDLMSVGDMCVAKIFSIQGRSIDLTIKSRGLGKIGEGIVFKINPNKIPRVIGKEGSMIKLIKDKTGCTVTAGQNGFVWIKGDKIENEVLARRAVEFISEKSFIDGLTEALENFLNNIMESKK